MFVDEIYNIYRKQGARKFCRSLMRKFTREFNNRICNIEIVDRLLFNISSDLLDKYKQEENSLEDIIKTTFEYQGYGCYRTIAPMQDHAEIRELSEIVGENDPRTVVEIGTAHGGTFYIWNRYFETAKQLVTMDIGFYARQKVKLFKQFTDDAEQGFIIGDTHSEATREALEDVLNDEIDFLFIDGDHTYDGVKRDFELYKPLVADGGIIAFHDIVKRETYPPEGVWRLWDELKLEYDTEEILHPPEDKRGIGVIRVHE